MSPITGGGGGVGTLNDLTDVVITAPSVNDVLMYDGVDWVNNGRFLFLDGRTGGQVLGSGAHTGGNPTDLVIEGRLLLGNNLSGINFTLGRTLDVRTLLLNGSTPVNFLYDLAGLTGTASGIINLQQISFTGSIGYTGGTVSGIRGLIFAPIVNVPTGLTISSIHSAFYQNTIGLETGTGHAAALYGFRMFVSHASTANVGTTANELVVFEVGITNRNKPVTNGYILKCTQPPGGPTSVLGNSYILYCANTYLNSANITNWYGCYIDVPVNPPNKWGYYQKNPDALNVYEGKSIYGAIGTPNSTVDNQGNQALKITANKIVNYPAAAETFIPCDANTVGAFAVTLPTAVGIPGRIYVIKKVDASANAVTVQTTGGQTIDGAATVVLNAQWQVTRVVSDGANWLIW